MKTAIYPFSADPIHNGHINNIKRLNELNVFNKIFVAIGRNYEKKTKYLFSDQEKLLIAKKALAPLGRNVTIEVFHGLLVHYAKKKNTNIIIRGARNSGDFEVEQNMAEFNKAYGLNTFIIPAPKNVFNISSTTIKAIVENGGLVHEYVPPAVKQALEEKILGITLIGVTGNTGAGKTSFCKKLAQINKNISYIEIDKLIKEIYKDNLEVQEKIKIAFSKNIYQKNNINRKKLAQIIFSDSLKRLELVEILRTPLKIALEEKIKNLQGLILVDCAYLTEYDLLPMVNNNIVLLTCSEATKQQRNKNASRIKEAQYTEKQLRLAIKSQQQNFLEINTEKKINYREIIKRLQQWQILRS
jgi:pantetheine-phosphate adenylyltransferase